MSEVKHTPGPWVVCNMDNWCCVEHTEWGTTVAEIGENDDLGLADARLIAAAPEMLEALERCQRVIANLISGKGTPAGAEIINHWAQCVESEAQARAAIAKAKGKA